MKLYNLKRKIEKKKNAYKVSDTLYNKRQRKNLFQKLLDFANRNIGNIMIVWWISIPFVFIILLVLFAHIPFYTIETVLYVWLLLPLLLCILLVISLWIFTHFYSYLTHRVRYKISKQCCRCEHIGNCSYIYAWNVYELFDNASYK